MPPPRKKNDPFQHMTMDDRWLTTNEIADPIDLSGKTDENVLPKELSMTNISAL